MPDSEWVKVDVVCAIAGDHVICATTIDDKLRARSKYAGVKISETVSRSGEDLVAGSCLTPT